MSNRKPWETASIELYIAHLNRTLGSLYVIEKEHVPVGGGKNCDFVLRDEAGKGPRVAAELVQIIDDPKAMEGDFFRVGLWNELRPELEALGVKGVVVGTPWDTPPCWMPRKLKKENTARLLAARIKAKLDENPTADTVEVDGLKVKRVPGLGIVGFGSHSGAHWGSLNPAATRAIETLIDKDDQAKVPDCHRVIVAVQAQTSLDAPQLIDRLAVRQDLDRFGNADEVLFMRARGAFEVVYRREIRDFFDAGGPRPTKDVRLIEEWLGARLMHEPTMGKAFELARGWVEREGTQSIGRDARSSIAWTAIKLVEGGNVEVGLWAVRKLVDDPDPIEETSEDNALTTVRGSVAWLAIRLAERADSSALPGVRAVAERLAADTNRHVRRFASLALEVLDGRQAPPADQ